MAAQAREISSGAARPSERCSLLASLGRVLAEDLYADRDFPPFQRSGRDGFACRAADLIHVPVVLHVVEEIPAGASALRNLEPGEAAEIMTGAPLPAGADCVVMVEYTECRKGDDQVKILRQSVAGEHFVEAGSEGKRGDVVLQRGTQITYAAIAVAAAIGKRELEVVKRPKVAVLSTGNELVEIGEQPEAHQIRNSNTYSLGAQVLAAGAEPVLLPIVRDEREHIRAALAEGLQYDLVLITGGVSAGKYDLVEEMLSELSAEYFFTGAMIQPGKPTVFARIVRDKRSIYCFGLPGNPVSTMVTFEVFARPILRALAGASPEGLPFVQAKLEEDMKIKPGLTRFLPARRGGDLNSPSVKPVAWRGSGDIVARSAANCYIVVPPDCTQLHAGEAVTILLAQGA